MLTLLGYLMVIVFVVLIMTNRLSAFVALTIIPLLFGLLGGFGMGLGPMMMKGLTGVAPAAFMLLFAIFYFSIMINVGLFDPLIEKSIKVIKGDPLKLLLMTTIATTFISLDGDGTTTCLITVSAFLPIASRLGVNPVYMASLGAMVNGILNLLPWGGPGARIQGALKVDAATLFVPMIPSIIVAVLFVWVLAYFIGKKERKRLGIASMDESAVEGLIASIRNEEAELKRPKLIWLNLILTLVVIGSLFTRLLPPPVVFMIGSAIALLINYPSVKVQQERIKANAPNILTVIVMIVGAGIFMGILTGTKMSDGIANSLVSVIPATWGRHMALITAVVSAPGTFFLSNDAFYFGILPILAQMGATYGVSAAEIGRAGLLGQPFHILCPFLAAIYLMCGMWKIKLSDYQKFMAFPALGIMIIYIAVAVIAGAIPL
jgi:citrate-Mg2+:H+ or citrate-Ca2+:H+ symporter, CitMHS family